MRKYIWLLVVVLILLPLSILLVSGFGTGAENYLAADGPRYYGEFATGIPQYDGMVTAVSYNIKFGHNIDDAIRELQQIESLAAADVIMLQEMDVDGVAEIAEALNLNYIYYPGANHAETSEDFGNAILSPWSIVADSKLFLPHKSIASGMQRIATKAMIQIAEQDVLTYSVHTETILSWPWQQQNQYEAIVEDIDPSARYVIVGGDLNTVTDGQVKNLEQTFATANMIRTTAGSGHTAERFNVEAVADHIFTRGFEVIDGGEIPQATASDHFPVWADLQFEG